MVAAGEEMGAGVAELTAETSAAVEPGSTDPDEAVASGAAEELVTSSSSESRIAVI